MFAVQIEPPLKEKIDAPIVELQQRVVDSKGQGRLILRLNAKKKVVSTCRQYQKAQASGYQALDPQQKSIESFYTYWCGALAKLKNATPAKTSYLRGFNLARDYQLLPNQIYGLSNQSLKVRLLNAKQNSILVDINQGRYRAIVSRLAMADMNGDGVEDALLSVVLFSKKLSFRDYGIYLVSRGTNHSSLKFIS